MFPTAGFEVDPAVKSEPTPPLARDLETGPGFCSGRASGWQGCPPGADKSPVIRVQNKARARRSTAQHGRARRALKCLCSRLTYRVESRDVILGLAGHPVGAGHRAGVA